MIERQSVRDARAAVVAANEETVETESAHELARIERHRAFAVGRVIRRAVGFVGVAIAAQVG